MEPNAACKHLPEPFCLQLYAPYLLGSKLPSVSALASLPLWTPSLFFFLSWVQLAYFILYIQFKCCEFRGRATPQPYALCEPGGCSTTAGPIEVEWALPSLMSRYPSKYGKILIRHLSSPPRFIKWLLFHWWSDILFLWSSLSEAQLCYTGDLWPILLL